MIAERQAELRVIESLNRAAHGAALLEPYLWEENTYCLQGAQVFSRIWCPSSFVTGGDARIGQRIGRRLRNSLNDCKI